MRSCTVAGLGINAGRVMHHLDLHQSLHDLSELELNGTSTVGEAYTCVSPCLGVFTRRFLRALRFCHILRILNPQSVGPARQCPFCPCHHPIPPSPEWSLGPSRRQMSVRRHNEVVEVSHPLLVASVRVPAKLLSGLTEPGTRGASVCTGRRGSALRRWTTTLR